MSKEEKPTGASPSLSRREFLRTVGTGALAVAGTSVLNACAPAATPAPTAAPPPPATTAPMATAAPTAATTLKLVAPADMTNWSMWASEPGRRKWGEEIAAQYLEKHPGIKTAFTWYEKPPLNQALTTAFMAGSGGPDMFYVDVITFNQFLDSGWMADLKGKLDETRFPPEAFEVSMRRPGHTYALPVEQIVSTVWYNAKLFRDNGITIPDSKQMTLAQFEDIATKFKAKGIIPLAAGTSDTAFGGFHTSSFLMRVMGKDKFPGLLDGTTAWEDPEVKQAFTLAKSWADRGFFNDTVQTLKGTDSYQLFFQGKAAMIHVGSFLLSNAVNPPDKGGAPTDFEFGIMMFPSVDGGKGNRLIGNRTGGMYAIWSKSKFIDNCVDFLNLMGTPENAEKWITYSQSMTWLYTGPNAKVHPMVKAQQDLLKQYEPQNPEITNRLFKEEAAAWTKWVGSGMYDKSITVDQMITELAAARKRDKG